MTNPEFKNLLVLFQQINMLHAENTAVTSRLAANAVRIGVVLHQIRATVDHSKFLLAIAAACPKISRRTCYNYMQVAARVAQNQFCNSSANLKRLPPSQRELAAQKIVAEMDWLRLPFPVETLAQHVAGKQLNTIYRDCGIKPPARRGESQPDPDAVHAWLEQHQPQMLGIAYDALPEKLQIMFNAQHRPAHQDAPAPTINHQPTPHQPLKPALSVQAFDLLTQLLDNQVYVYWDDKFSNNFDHLLKTFRVALTTRKPRP